jgi:dolichol-phosphate mannosyltransferase
MIIIPTYNERENVRILVEKIRAAAGDIPILFVDDSSPDGTAAAIRQLQSEYPNILLKVRPEKQGLGAAYRDAFQYVIENNLADFVLSMDADLSHPPEVLPGLLKNLEHSSVVVGSRYHPQGRVENWNLWRRTVSRLGNLYARFFTGVPVFDLTSGMVAYRVEALKKIDFSRTASDGFAFVMEMKVLLHQAGEKIYEHPITFIERREGKSKFSLPIFFEGILYPLRCFIKKWLF